MDTFLTKTAIPSRDEGSPKVNQVAARELLSEMQISVRFPTSSPSGTGTDLKEKLERFQKRGLVPVWDSISIQDRHGTPRPFLGDLLELMVLSEIWVRPKNNTGFRGVLGEAPKIGANMNIAWIPQSLLNWPPHLKMPDVRDYPHANTIDMAIAAGNKIALELLLPKASTTLIFQSLVDLLERNQMNVAHHVCGRGWKKLTANQLFGLVRLSLFLHHRGAPELGNAFSVERTSPETMRTDPKTRKVLKTLFRPEDSGAQFLKK